jgi:hypothetical protein
MVRLKFLLFAVPVIGLWGAHLYLSSPLFAERAVKEARARVASAPVAVAQVVLQTRVELQRLALHASGSAPALVFAQGGRAAPGTDKVGALMDALKEVAPADIRANLVVGVLNEAGSAYARGEAEPTTDESAFDLKTVAEAGADGLAQDAFGQTYLFYSIPIAVPAGAEPRVAARMILGAPLMEQGIAERLSQQMGLSALALIQGGTVLQSGGPDKAVLPAAVKDMLPGVTDVVLQRGQVAALGPLKLPVLTQKDAAGGQAPLALAAREAIPTTPYEVISVASLAPAMIALAAYQRIAVAAFGALIFLTVVWTFLMGSGVAAGEEEEEAPSRTEPPPAPAPLVGPALAEARSSASELPMKDAPPAPEASPDDFVFGTPGPQERPSDLRTVPSFRSPLMPEQEEQPEPAPGPVAPAPAPIPDFGVSAGPGSDNPFDFENQPTRAYTVPPLGALPPVPSPTNAAMATGNEDFNPDATRVTAIPDELLRASARPSRPEMPAVTAPKPMSTSAPPRVSAVTAAPAPISDEQHFQDVYKEFIATRERCGEPADGLTFEKFALKLKKNREQLIQKYSCRTVRFQVYVKEGKAALKATPVKE